MRLNPVALLGLACCAALLALVCAVPEIARADRLPLIGSGAAAPLTAGSVNQLTNQLIVPVNPDSVPCLQTVTFNNLPGGENPGTSYDDILQSEGLFFAERFEGQTLSYNGDFDVVSGTPTNPLALQVGAPSRNLDVFLFTTSNVLGGLGNLGFPDLDAIGEGSMAVYFPSPQSRVSFDLVGGNGGSATLGFYGADGSLLDNVVLSGLADLRYGFATADGEPSISGILIQSTDPSGIGVDNICHDGGITSTHAATWGRVKTLYR